MTTTELRELDAAELAERLAEAKEELFNLRFQLATNQLDNTARLTEVRREVARILTVMREREIEAWNAQRASAGRGA
jgi:large subunit ribosomal protein L29